MGLMDTRNDERSSLLFEFWIKEKAAFKLPREMNDDVIDILESREETKALLLISEFIAASKSSGDCITESPSV